MARVYQTDPPDVVDPPVAAADSINSIARFRANRASSRLTDLHSQFSFGIYFPFPNSASALQPGQPGVCMESHLLPLSL